MSNIITDLDQLRKPAEPLEFLTDKGVEKEEGEEIIAKIKAELEADKNILALAAPQIGINKRVFCIRFNDVIKTFINPIITKKSGNVVSPETFVSMPGQEILIGRPEEVTVVYYNDEFKYEENKLLGAAAKIFDQHCQLLDGVTPAELGLISNVAEVGSLADLPDEEIQEAVKFYKDEFIPAKMKAIAELIEGDEELKKKYNMFKMTEDVINGRTQVIMDTPRLNRATRRALAKSKKSGDKK